MHEKHASFCSFQSAVNDSFQINEWLSKFLHRALSEHNLIFSQSDNNGCHLSHAQPYFRENSIIFLETTNHYKYKTSMLVYKSGSGKTPQLVYTMIHKFLYVPLFFREKIMTVFILINKVIDTY